MRDMVTCAWRELTRRKGRTAMNVLGYALAVGTLVTLLTVLIFSRDAANAVLENTGTFFAAYSPATCGVPCYIPQGHSVSEAFVGPGGIYTYSTVMQYLPKLSSFKYIKRMAPYILFRFLDANEHSTVTVGGFDPKDADIVGPLACGPEDVTTDPINTEMRYLRAGDRDVVLVERTYAEPRALQPGNFIKVAGKKFRILAIADTTGSTRAARADLYMMLPDLQRLIAQRIPDHAQDANIMLAQATSAKVLAQAKREMQFASFSAASGSSCHKPAVMVLGMNERSVWLLALLIGLFTLVSSMKSQLAAVMERRREIGILKAIGWTNGAITGQVLVESLLQAALGGALGCAAAVLVLVLVPIARLAHLAVQTPITISPLVLGFGLALALVGGAFAGSIPAFIAARQRPAIAMRQL
jgi:ABC-type lipoprotein release transport system permease subunit